MMHRIMIVDDEENILKALRRLLDKNKDWEIDIYTSARDALRHAKAKNYELVLSDYRMPEMDGVKFLAELKHLQPEAMRMIISGYTDLEALLGAINDASIYRFISKPWNDYELMVTVEQALSYRAMMAENRHLANQVREQQQKLDNQKTAMEELEARHPDITRVDWAPDGSIHLNEKDC